MSFEHAKQYLARVLHWPDAHEEAAFGNIHWTFKKQGEDRALWTGRAVRSADQGVKAIEFALKGADTLDIYACMSSQRTANEKTSQKGFKYLTPVRNQGNAVKLKSLFLDIDLKGGDTGYGSAAEAGTALNAFIAATGMPRPTMVVGSGGGFHVYWCLMRALTPEEWTPLAYALAEATKKHGLKCDTQCTVDCARVLRVPNTWNRKQAQPRAVQIVGPVQDFDYSVERIEKALEPYKNPNLTPSHPVLPQLTPLNGANDDLVSGVDTSKVDPLKAVDVAKQCPFILDAIKTRGAANTNPLWNLTTFIATFMEDGRKMAHVMAQGHPGYSPSSTDELFDRKEREKAQKNLGWPSCITISGQGSKFCQSCPNFAKGKSPLNFARPAVSPVMAPPAAPPPSDLPKGYARRPDGIVVQLLENKDSGTTEEIPVCSFPLKNPWYEKTDNDYILHFESVTDAGQVTMLHLPFSFLNGKEMRSELNRQGLIVPYGPKNTERFYKFMEAWTITLQSTRQSVEQASFGWTQDRHTRKTEGFIYGGQMWTPSGPKVAAMPKGYGHYNPAGDVCKWVEAAKIITDQQRPQLEAIVAASFGAPLMKFSGHTGVLMSAYSTESGAGKSTAMDVAHAVWGDPVLGKQALDDTGNAAMGVMSTLKSMPMMWDELKSEEASRNMVNLVYRLTGTGRDKRRMYADTTLRTPKKFETLLICASNESLLEYADQNMKVSDATYMRIFEFEVPKIPKAGLGQLDPSRVMRAIAELRSHYGNIGLEYAKWLGANHVQIDKEVGDYLEHINKAVSVEQEERFWTTLIGVTCMGARYAKQLGFMQFDEAALEAFMLDTLLTLRARKGKRSGDITQDINAGAVLSDYFSSRMARHTIWTNRIHIARGAPALNSIKIIHQPNNLEEVHIQIGMEDKLMHIHNGHFRQWLADNGYPVFKTLQILNEKFGPIVDVTGRMAAGTNLASLMNITMKRINLSGTNTNFLDYIGK